MASSWKIIALCGRRGAGKDFIANELVREHGFVNLKFAGPIKETLARLFSLSHEQIEGTEKEKID